MKTTIFATVNGREITGEDILYMRKRIFNEQSDHKTFVQTPSDENQAYLNTEALQKLIDIYALTALAKFEGITVSDDEISGAVYELRAGYEDEFEWESAIHDLGINDSNMRDVFYHDLMIDKLLYSHSEEEEYANESIEDFYQQNINSMTLPDTYSFIELEIKDPAFLKIAATVLSQKDTASIIKEATNHQIEAVLNEEIPSNKLPDTLQEIFKDLEENKIATIPMEDNSVVFVKLLRKFSGKTLSLEDATEGIVEYLKYQKNMDKLEYLTDSAVEKCEILYFHTEDLKKLN